MNPLSWLYATGVRARNALYDRGTLPVQRLQGPVISVGNLSVGGSGKTPFVMLLGKLLQARGINFDVISRGYGRQTRGVALVDPAGSARDFGDEPLLIARRLGIPVIVGEDRHEAGRVAEREFGPRFHILDDGFQHRALARDFDIVMLNHEDAHERLLPLGRLREPVSALRRADAVVVTSGAPVDGFPLGEKALWVVQRRMLPQSVPQHPVAFCGIARPRTFFLQLRFCGIEPAVEAIYRDHHLYNDKDIRELLEAREQSDAGGFVTTEKDAINLGAYLSALAPLAVVPVHMQLQDAEIAIDTMLRRIEERRRGS